MVQQARHLKCIQKLNPNILYYTQFCKRDAFFFQEKILPCFNLGFPWKNCQPRSNTSIDDVQLVHLLSLLVLVAAVVNVNVLALCVVIRATTTVKLSAFLLL